MEKYIHYKALDFAEEPAFIQWVQNGTLDQNSIWQQLIEHSPSLRKEIAEAKEIVSIFRLENDSPLNKSKEADLFKRIESKIAEGQGGSSVITKQKSGIIKYLAPVAAAAAVLMLFFIFIPRQGLETFATTANQSKIEHALPDESTVILDANSSISYVEGEKFMNARRIKLEGQAFFKIQKGEKFIVETEYGDIEVLGTTFNVNAFEGLYVQCVTGKVKVKNANSSILTTAGEISHLENGVLVKDSKNISQLGWYKSKHEYKGKSLGTVFADIEKEYQIEIESSDTINNLLYTGFFETDNLEQALKSVTWPLGFNFEIKGEKVIIQQ